MADPMRRDAALASLSAALASLRAAIASSDAAIGKEIEILTRENRELKKKLGYIKVEAD